MVATDYLYGHSVFLMTNLRTELDSILWLFAVCGRVILTVVFC